MIDSKKCPPTSLCREWNEVFLSINPTPPKPVQQKSSTTGVQYNIPIQQSSTGFQCSSLTNSNSLIVNCALWKAHLAGGSTRTKSSEDGRKNSKLQASILSLSSSAVLATRLTFFHFIFFRSFFSRISSHSLDFT